MGNRMAQVVTCCDPLLPSTPPGLRLCMTSYPSQPQSRLHYSTHVMCHMPWAHDLITWYMSHDQPSEAGWLFYLQQLLHLYLSIQYGYVAVTHFGIEVSHRLEGEWNQVLYYGYCEASVLSEVKGREQVTPQLRNKEDIRDIYSRSIIRSPWNK